MADAIIREEKRDENGRFIVPPKSPGRPKGARAKLGEQFCQDVYAKWQEVGERCIDEMIADKPGDFVKLVASMLPKDINVNVSDGSDMTDEELHERIRNLASQLAPFLSDRTGDANQGTEGAAGKAIATRVH